jgi:hypothetical protein
MSSKLKMRENSDQAICLSFTGSECVAGSTADNQKRVGFIFPTPNSKSGTRRNALGSGTLKVLIENQLTQFDEMMGVGERRQDHDLGFPSV